MPDERENQDSQDQQEQQSPAPDLSDYPTNNPGTRDDDWPIETK